MRANCIWTDMLFFPDLKRIIAPRYLPPAAKAGSFRGESHATSGESPFLATAFNRDPASKHLGWK
jgi:hypothetical protein